MVYSEDKSSKNYKEIINFLRKADQIKFNIKYKIDSNLIIGQEDNIKIAAITGEFGSTKSLMTLLSKYFSEDAAKIELKKIGLRFVDDKVGMIMADGEEGFVINQNTKFNFLIETNNKIIVKVKMIGDTAKTEKVFYYLLKLFDKKWLIVDMFNENEIIQHNDEFVALRPSSILMGKNTSFYAYDVKNIWDENLKTAWVPMDKGNNGINEWIEFTLFQGRLINAIKIINGYAKNELIYKANNRVKRLCFSFDDGTKFETELKDEQMGFQKVLLPKPKTVERVRITILEVYPGSKYHDTCISEVDFE